MYKRQGSTLPFFLLNRACPKTTFIKYLSCQSPVIEDCLKGATHTILYLSLIHIFVADKAQEQLIRDLKVEYFETLDEAYARARELKGPDATLTLSLIHILITSPGLSPLPALPAAWVSS